METIQMISRVCSISVDRALGWFEGMVMRQQAARLSAEGKGPLSMILNPSPNVEMLATRTDLLESDRDAQAGVEFMDVDAPLPPPSSSGRLRDRRSLGTRDLDEPIPSVRAGSSSQGRPVEPSSKTPTLKLAAPKSTKRPGSQPAYDPKFGSQQPLPDISQRFNRTPLVIDENVARKIDLINDQIQTRACQQIAKTQKIEVCRACTRKNGDPCRFREFRGLTIGGKGRYIDQSFIDKSTDKDAVVSIGEHTSAVLPSDSSESYILNIASAAFHRLLKEELTFLSAQKTTFLRPPFAGTRQSCDHCETSIFNVHFMCTKCGMDICMDCALEFDDTSLSSKLGYCKKHTRHFRSDLMVVYRLPMDKCIRTMKDAETWASRAPELMSPSFKAQKPIVKQILEPEAFVNGARVPSHIPFDIFADSSNYMRVAASRASFDGFQKNWRNREIVVVTCLLDRVTADWSPLHFIEEHGTEVTKMADCRTGAEVEMEVGTFFEGFLGRERKPVGADGKEMILKLKDWPADKHFREKFPTHYDDFMQLLPFKPYYHPLGELNLAARLPSTCVPPDLGPKMYNAYGSDDGENGKGTTNLHLDMADAVNVMTYSSSNSSPDAPAAAVWDIYSYADLPSLRAFLRDYAQETGCRIDDPIHDQWIYLNAPLRERLYREYGVRGWRVYQNPGDAVFVPAGCAHQVCNYRDAIKVAIDFVSPESVEMCEGLTKEFRLLTATHRRRPDLLQLKTIFWYAWRECWRNVRAGTGGSMVAATQAREEVREEVKRDEGKGKEPERVGEGGMKGTKRPLNTTDTWGSPQSHKHDLNPPAFFSAPTSPRVKKPRLSAPSMSPSPDAEEQVTHLEARRLVEESSDDDQVIFVHSEEEEEEILEEGTVIPLPVPNPLVQVGSKLVRKEEDSGRGRRGSRSSSGAGVSSLSSLLSEGKGHGEERYRPSEGGESSSSRKKHRKSSSRGSPAPEWEGRKVPKDHHSHGHGSAKRDNTYANIPLVSISSPEGSSSPGTLSYMIAGREGKGPRIRVSVGHEHAGRSVTLGEVVGKSASQDEISPSKHRHPRQGEDRVGRSERERAEGAPFLEKKSREKHKHRRRDSEHRHSDGHDEHRTREKEHRRHWDDDVPSA
ncbi:hypothetical protein HDV00_003711 [Rhizophlyctis rosea]|nr:hypothetical protein HDV00_003711 [Rhizophlyctis rosea]